MATQSRRFPGCSGHRGPTYPAVIRAPMKSRQELKNLGVNQNRMCPPTYRLISPPPVFSLSSALTVPPVLTPRLRGTRAGCLHKATHPTHAVPTLFPPALAIPREFLNSIERSKNTPSTTAPAFKHKLLNRGHRGPNNITHSRPGTSVSLTQDTLPKDHQPSKKLAPSGRRV